MDEITIRINCDLTKELEEKLRFVTSEIIFKFDGVHTVSYFNETLNKKCEQKHHLVNKRSKYG